MRKDLQLSYSKFLDKVNRNGDITEMFCSSPNPPLLNVRILTVLVYQFDKKEFIPGFN